jgi:hypothetical protein
MRSPAPRWRPATASCLSRSGRSGPSIRSGGSRRIWACLGYVDGLAINQKRVYGTMKG